MSLLHAGDTFPRLTLNIPGARAIEVPVWFGGEFGVVLFNRGAWCPYCTAQLRAFQRAGESLAAAGIGGQGDRERVLKRRHRPPRARRRYRPGPLPAQARRRVVLIAMGPDAMSHADISFSLDPLNTPRGEQ